MGGDVPCVCIVDAYSTGSLYAGELRKRGLRSIHVQSRDPIPSAYVASFVASDHDWNYVFDGDLERCVRAVAAHHPLCVIAGIESGVLLADQLSEALGVPNNGTALSRSRRDKFEMHRRVEAAGLRGIPSFLTRDWAAAEAWLRRLERFPVVLKPPASAGTQLVYTCEDLAEARRAFDTILATPSTMDEPNEDVLVQPFITGDEYIVNTVSCAGRHVMTSVWKMAKVRGRHTLYDSATLQPYETQLAHRDFTFGVLDALGIRYGGGHTELFATADGPCLIETGARTGGQRGSLLVERATGLNTVQAVIDSYLMPEQFLARHASPYRLNKHACRVTLISPRGGTLTALPRLDEVRALASFDDVTMLAKPARPIARTIDLWTVPGYVDLVHPDPDVIARDRERIRALEADGFYEIADEA